MGEGEIRNAAAIIYVSPENGITATWRVHLTTASMGGVQWSIAGVSKHKPSRTGGECLARCTAALCAFRYLLVRVWAVFC